MNGSLALRGLSVCAFGASASNFAIRGSLASRSLAEPRGIRYLLYHLVRLRLPTTMAILDFSFLRSPVPTTATVLTTLTTLTTTLMTTTP
jgi:hypothetical protein